MPDTIVNCQQLFKDTFTILVIQKCSIISEGHFKLLKTLPFFDCEDSQLKMSWVTSIFYNEIAIMAFSQLRCKVFPEVYQVHSNKVTDLSFEFKALHTKVKGVFSRFHCLYGSLLCKKYSN